MGSIYRIWNTHSRKSYIGQSYKPYNRIRQHLIPGREKGSLKIHADLHKYPPESWKWEILAHGINERSCRIIEPPLGHAHKSINTLECELIRRYDSIKKGYNDHPGGGVKYRQTVPESYTPAQMQRDIYDAIDAYRFQHPKGTSQKAYRHEREAQLQHEREIQLQREREAQRVPELEAQLQREKEVRHHLEQEVQRLREQVAQLQGGQQHRAEDVQEQGCFSMLFIFCGLFGLAVVLASC